ncbi:endo-1,4-beta-xylanase [Ruminiclostridium cellobioparum]|uniref:endo-1,4-beta-xylanase n=1 Tax=Ruminiclostridium cellobioparum TaxID=29355 RepID=UPI0006877F35|nr:endo-1,4-beta-xylanase [Ruminiclostridium cellobioparum]
MSSTIFRNWRKAAAVFLVLCLVISLMPVNSMVYAESTTVYHETFAGGVGKAVQSGGAKLTQVTDKVFEGNDDGAALYVSNRANGWDAADFKFADLHLENGKTYNITINGYVDPNVEVSPGGLIVAQAVNPSPEAYDDYMGQAVITTGAAFTITSNYTVNNTYDRIRIQSNDAGAAVPFYIGNILITAENTPPATTEKEIYHEDFATGAGKSVQSGGANLTQVTDKVFEGNDDGAALYVSNRINNYDAADFKFADVGMQNGKTYTVTVKGYVDAGEAVPAGAQAYLQTVDSYGWLAGADMIAGEAFTLTKKFTADTTKDSAVRVQSNVTGATVPFYIGDILITETVIGGDTEEPPRDPALPFQTITFENQTSGGFAARSGGEKLTVTNEANHTEGGTYSLKVEGRTDTWHGPSLRVEKYVDKGSEYKVTAWVKLIEPESSQIQLSTQVGSSNPGYSIFEAKTISTNDGWVKYEGKHLYNSVLDEYLTIYIESSNNATASFYIDDISFEKTQAGPIEIQKDIAPIKDVYKDDFLIGTAISGEDLSGVRLELLKMHNNSATAGNDMKPGNLQPTKGNYTFAAADTMVDKVLSEGMKMHGHVLVWHNQTGEWMNTATDGSGNKVPLPREEALQNMTTHIKTVVEHFGNKVISWDVVNEAMGDNPPNPSDWRSSLRNDSMWEKAIGPDYVEKAFLAAREVLDAHPDWNIKLYYNDYNEDNQKKSQAIYNMVKEINDKYAENHPGKLLIDGIGMQAHYNIKTNPVNVELSLERFISLGVEVSITELDITAGENSQLSEKLAEAQGYLYAQLFKIFKAHAADIERVTIWGMDDGTSWRSSQNPLLFDRNLQAKLAYYGVVDPDKYMSEHEPTTPVGAKQSTANFGTPVIDGTIDSIWSNTPALAINEYQMAWQGATGIARTLWDDNNLYVLIQVSDEQLDKSSINEYEQDSVEVFVDENNGKTSFYQEDDGQYRVNYDNETSFNPAEISEGFESAARVSGTNYTVEMKIPFKTLTPANGIKIGFDAQVNDAQNSARQSVAAWNDQSGSGYQDTSVFGVLTLTGKGGSGEPEEPGNPGNSGGSNTGSGGGSNSGSSYNSTPAAGTKAESNVTVKLTAAVNADGSANVKVTGKTVEDILKDLSKIKDGVKPTVVIFAVNVPSNANAATLELPADTLGKILEADGNASIKVSAGIGELLFDSRAMKTISETGTGIIEIKISKAAAADLAGIPADAADRIADRPVFEFTVSRGGTTISGFNGSAVSVSIPYTLKQDEDPNAVLVYYIDSNNSLIPVRGYYHNGTVEFITAHFSKFAVGYNKVSFSDVKSTDSYYDAVTYLGAREIATGTGFDPKRAVTRGEAIVMLMKAYDIKPLAEPEDNFSDAAGEFAGYYAKAREIGLTGGVGYNRIDADAPLTREMLYTLVYNLKKYLGELPAAGTAVTEYKGFGDENKLSAWAVNTVKQLVEAGIIKDGTSTQLNPKFNCSRGKFAIVLQSLLSNNTIN